MDISSLEFHKVTNLTCFNDINDAITSSSEYIVVIDCYTKWFWCV